MALNRVLFAHGSRENFLHLQQNGTYMMLGKARKRRSLYGPPPWASGPASPAMQASFPPPASHHASPEPKGLNLLIN